MSWHWKWGWRWGRFWSAECTGTIACSTQAVGLARGTRVPLRRPSGVRAREAGVDRQWPNRAPAQAVMVPASHRVVLPPVAFLRRLCGLGRQLSGDQLAAGIGGRGGRAAGEHRLEPLDLGHRGRRFAPAVGEGQPLQHRVERGRVRDRVRDQPPQQLRTVEYQRCVSGLGQHLGGEPCGEVRHEPAVRHRHLLSQDQRPLGTAQAQELVDGSLVQPGQRFQRAIILRPSRPAKRIRPPSGVAVSDEMQPGEFAPRRIREYSTCGSL